MSASGLTRGISLSTVSAMAECLPITWRAWSYDSGWDGMIGSFHVATVFWGDGSYKVRIYMFNCSSSWKGFKSVENAKAFAQKTLAEKLEEIML